MNERDRIREEIAKELLKSLKRVMGFGIYKEGQWEALSEKERQPYLYMANQILSKVLIEADDQSLPENPHDKKAQQYGNYYDAEEEWTKASSFDEGIRVMIKAGWKKVVR